MQLKMDGHGYVPHPDELARGVEHNGQRDPRNHLPHVATPNIGLHVMLAHASDLPSKAADNLVLADAPISRVRQRGALARRVQHIARERSGDGQDPRDCAVPCELDADVVLRREKLCRPPAEACGLEQGTRAWSLAGAERHAATLHVREMRRLLQTVRCWRCESGAGSHGRDKSAGSEQHGEREKKKGRKKRTVAARYLRMSLLRMARWYGWIDQLSSSS